MIVCGRFGAWQFRGLTSAVSMVGVLAFSGMALAATVAPAPAPAPAPVSPAVSASGVASTGDVATVGVTGFRSAHFGMTEAEVKAAASKDFGVKADAIVAGTNAAERTKLLSVTVPDLLPGGGTAVVSYVFGYKSKTLIQVGISWSPATDPSLTDAELYADGEVLRSHFAAAGYKPDTIKSGLVLQNGLLLFRGEDADGHATILILQGTFKAGDGQQKTLKPVSLALLYAADPQNPDVFKVAAGAF